MLNKATLIGRLGDEPEVRATASGSTVTTLSVATSEKYKNKQGDWETQTEWHKVICFGRTAEVAAQYLNKGSMVYVEGAIKTTKWESKTGEKKKDTSIHASVLKMLGGKGSSDSAPRQTASPALTPKPFEYDPLDDEIPF
jgi:single-strand DNA-binding protein